jgi:hypothetical protein
MRKVIIGTIEAVTLLLAGMLAWNAEAAPLSGCCHIGGVWACGMACSGHSPSPKECCKLYGRWHCPCPPPPHWLPRAARRFHLGISSSMVST